jgi:hypothetical protein
VTRREFSAGPLCLVSRQWFIQDEEGHKEEVQGIGVLGKQPVGATVGSHIIHHVAIPPACSDLCYAARSPPSIGARSTHQRTQFL